MVGTITDASGSASVVGTYELDALQTQLDGITGKVTDYVAAQILVLDNDLQAQITSNDTDIATNVSNIATNVTNLSNLTILVGTITDASGSASVVGTELDALQTQLDGITGKVTDYVAAQILVLDNHLQGQIDSNDTDIATNVTNLSNLTTLVGTITDAS